MTKRNKTNSVDASLKEAKANFVSSIESFEPKNIIKNNPKSVLMAAFLLGVGYKFSKRKLVKLVPTAALLFSSIFQKQE